MLGHDRARLGNLNHLAALQRDVGDRLQVRATLGTGGGDMPHDAVGIVYQAARDPRMSGLTAALLPAPLAQAMRPGPLGRPITGGRFVAVVAILIQSGFQLLKARGQLRHFPLVGRHQLLDPRHQRFGAGSIDREDFIP
jgi:hypothetical protein